jgi:hypothetical protein
MNARAVVGVVGAVTLLLGLLGLFRPEWTMNFLGYAVASNAAATFVRGEVRAVYGGLMVAAAVFTLLAAPAPRANQGRLLLLATLWLGAGAGRLFVRSCGARVWLAPWRSARRRGPPLPSLFAASPPYRRHPQEAKRHR